MAEPDDDLNLVPPPADLDTFGTDAALVEAVRRYGAEEHLERLSELGLVAGSQRSARWAELVERNPPRLRTHDPYGRRVDEVDYHPAWHRLLQTGVRAGLTAAAWAPDAPKAAHTARAAAFIVWSQVESGHTGPLSTTYGTVPTLGADPALEAVWLPRLASRSYESGLRPAQAKMGALSGLAVTERDRGCDVRSLATTAVPAAGGPVEGGPTYRLTGCKWYVGGPMSDVFVVLAQAPGGVTAFLLPRVLADGARNPFRLRRLKETLGRRSDAAAEVELDGSWAVRLGEEGRGATVVTALSSATRLDGVLGSAGLMRHALVRAVHHARHRQAFGSALVDKPLMQNVLADLALETEAATALGMRLAAAVDGGETELLRVGVPVAKLWVGKRVLPVVAEALECLGGNGFVEEHGMARVLRDCAAGSLWEGTGNVNALDVLRTMSVQPRAIDVLLGEVNHARGADHQLDAAMDEVATFLQAATREARRDPSTVEAGARWLVERLAVVLQASLLVRYAPEPVTSAFLATRVAGGGGALFGTLPVGRRTTAAIVERAFPG